ncbi:MAG: 2-dehydro-3-deoxyphosphogluconate aldolase, partial [Paenibacillaceae bacterium]|nr:2-dehydro-3-deoxyphosphogluconate aldolase [Paenibacillaceae bacterium]
MDHLQGKQELERTKIVAILRGIKENHIHGVVDALRRGGITVLEITMNTPGALSMIANLQSTFADQLYIGAGTVLDTNDAKEALAAGAKFIVTPNTDEEAIRH